MATPGPTHRIRKATLDVRFADELSASGARRTLQQRFESTVTPALVACFDEVDDGRIRFVEKLEIELGRITLDRLDRESVRQAVSLQLSRVLPAGEDLQSAGGPGSHQAIAEDRRAVPSLEQVLLEFLRYGRMPWYAPVNSVTELESQLEQMPLDQQRAMAQRLRVAFDAPSSRIRFAIQFSDKAYAWLMRQLNPHVAEWYLKRSSQSAVYLDVSELKQATLAVAAQLSRDASMEDVAIEKLIAKHLPDHPVDNDGNGGITKKPTASDNRDVEVDAAEVDDQPAHENRDRDEFLEVSPWYVQAAGVVLLHPFLERFFGALDLLDTNGQFSSFDSRATAVHLLHYLVTGAEQPEEWETTLLKMLCGFPSSVPLIKQLRLETEMKNEADHLLTAVIDHWQKLGNTSPDGLRESFLRREGKVTRESGRLRLVVEQTSLDVLLEFLPWSVAIVRLPWMDSPLWVDWA